MGGQDATQRAALVRFLQAVAAVLGGTAALLGLLAWAGVTEGATLGRALLAGYGSANAPQQGDHAFMLLLLLTWANASACLWLSVLLLAQERATWLAGALLLALNAAVALAWGYVLGAVLAGALLLASVRWRGAWQHTQPNPVTRKELRGRMRGGRSFIVIVVYLVLMSVFTVVVYALQLDLLTGSSIIETGRLGRSLFAAVAGAQMLLVVLIVPALTAGAISSERERHTYDLLRLTLLPLPTLLVGKLTSALAFIVLLVLLALPLQSIAFLFGGVSQADMLIVLAGLLLAAVLVGAMGICFSAFAPRTMTATLRVYGVVVGALVGLPVLSNLLFGGAYGSALQGVSVVRSNPLLETWLLYGDMLLSNLNPIAALNNTQIALVNAQSWLLVDVTLASTSTSVTVLSAWAVMMVSYALLAAGLVVWGIYRTRQDDERA